MFNVYPSNGTSIYSGATMSRALMFDTTGNNGSYTIPSGINLIQISAQGSQGGGGGAHYSAYYAGSNVNSFSSRLGGYGARGEVKRVLLQVTAGDIISWTYSAGGVVGTNGFTATGDIDRKSVV